MKNAALFILFAILPAASAFGQDESDRAQRAAQIWNSLTPERQQALLRNWQRYEAMTPEQRAQVQENFNAYQSMPEQRQQALSQKWSAFQSLPNDQRQRVEDDWRVGVAPKLFESSNHGESPKPAGGPPSASKSTVVERRAQNSPMRPQRPVYHPSPRPRPEPSHRAQKAGAPPKPKDRRNKPSR